MKRLKRQNKECYLACNSMFIIDSALLTMLILKLSAIGNNNYNI